MARRPWSPLLGLVVGWLGGCHGVGYHIDSLEYIRDPRGGYEEEIERDVPVLGWLNVLPLVELRYDADVDEPAELLVDALGALGETELAPDDLRRFRVIALAAEAFQRDTHSLVRTTALAAIGEHLRGGPAPGRRLGELPFESGRRVQERFQRLQNVYEGMRSGLLPPDLELLAATIESFGRVGYAQLVDLYPILRLLSEAATVFEGRARQATLAVLPILAYQAAWLGMDQGLKAVDPMVREAAVEVSFVLEDEDVLLALLRQLRVETHPQVLRRAFRRLGELDREGMEASVVVIDEREGSTLRRSALDYLAAGIQAPEPSVSAVAMVVLSRHYADHVILDPYYWTSWNQQRVAAEAENG